MKIRILENFTCRHELDSFSVFESICDEIGSDISTFFLEYWAVKC